MGISGDNGNCQTPTPERYAVAVCDRITEAGLLGPTNTSERRALRVACFTGCGTTAAVVAATSINSAIGTALVVVAAACIAAILSTWAVHARNEQRAHTDRDTLHQLGDLAGEGHRSLALATIAAVTDTPGSADAAVRTARLADIYDLTYPERVALTEATGERTTDIATFDAIAGRAGTTLFSLAVDAASSTLVHEAVPFEAAALDMTVNAVEQLRAHPHWDERYATGDASPLTAAGDWGTPKRSFDDVVAELATILDTVAATGGDPVELADAYTALADTWDGTAAELAHTVADIWAVGTQPTATSQRA